MCWVHQGARLQPREPAVCAQTSGLHLEWERIGFCQGAKDHVNGVVSASLSLWLQAVLEEDTGSGFCGWQSRATCHPCPVLLGGRLGKPRWPPCPPGWQRSPRLLKACGQAASPRAFRQWGFCVPQCQGPEHHLCKQRDRLPRWDPAVTPPLRGWAGGPSLGEPLPLPQPRGWAVTRVQLLGVGPWERRSPWMQGLGCFACQRLPFGWEPWVFTYR